MQYTAEANRGLRSLCRNKSLSNAHSSVNNATGYTNFHVSLADITLTNNTGTIPGHVSITASNMSAVGAGGGTVFVASGLDTSFTAASAPSPIDLTAQGRTVP
ncbi:hypothetical protein EDB86DRAFT_2941753 [Lactarius hatsudake]|nr:hypothetical protein EDB86DRAFT_2957535 [Lactarius hatsudake]KAH8989955.1 hypothetical protein EDB86DRAFT_2941753 [Lactarius hatsudake]